MRRTFCALALVAFSAGLTGCASIVDGTSQVVSVTTRMANQEVAGAKCELTNDKGKFFVTTPGTVTVHRAYVHSQILKCDSRIASVAAWVEDKVRVRNALR